MIKKLKHLKSEILLSLISIILTIIGLLLAYGSFKIALPFYEEYKTVNNFPDINGNWEISFETLSSSYEPYIGDTNTYNIYIIGTKETYKGKGERFLINEKEINYQARDRIELELSIKNNQYIYGLFDLHGQRKTDGYLQVWLKDDNEGFRGFFKGNAANTIGKVSGKKINLFDEINQINSIQNIK